MPVAGAIAPPHVSEGSSESANHTSAAGRKAKLRQSVTCRSGVHACFFSGRGAVSDKGAIDRLFDAPLTQSNCVSSEARPPTSTWQLDLCWDRRASTQHDRR